jgi:hypothetical protein
VAILLWVFPDGKLPAGRWRRPSVILLVSGLLLGVAASSSGVVAVARGDVRITATGDLVNPPGGWFVIVDIAFDAVRDDLVGVVHEAFQPTQVSMWLVEAGSGHDTGSVRG